MFPPPAFTYSLLSPSTHHIPRRGEPLPAFDNTERAVPELLEQAQVLLADQAGEHRLLLALQWGCGGGRRLPEGAGWLRLEVSVQPLPTEHLQAHKTTERQRRSAAGLGLKCFCVQVVTHTHTHSEQAPVVRAGLEGVECRAGCASTRLDLTPYQ